MAIPAFWASSEPTPGNAAEQTAIRAAPNAQNPRNACHNLLPWTISNGDGTSPGAVGRMILSTNAAANSAGTMSHRVGTISVSLSVRLSPNAITNQYRINAFCSRDISVPCCWGSVRVARLQRSEIRGRFARAGYPGFHCIPSGLRLLLPDEQRRPPVNARPPHKPGQATGPAHRGACPGSTGGRLR